MKWNKLRVACESSDGRWRLELVSRRFRLWAVYDCTGDCGSPKRYAGQFATLKEARQYVEDGKAAWARPAEETA